MRLDKRFEGDGTMRKRGLAAGCNEGELSNILIVGCASLGQHLRTVVSLVFIGLFAGSLIGFSTLSIILTSEAQAQSSGSNNSGNTSGSSTAVGDLAGDIYQAGPYAGIATNKMYEDKERGSQTLPSLGQGLGSTARDFPSRTGKIPGDSEGRSTGQPEDANLNYTASRYQNHKIETGPYRETMAKLDSQQMLTMYNDLSNYSRVTQAAVACSLANAAVCNGKNAAFQYAISHAGFGLQQYARLREEVKDTDMARELTACLRDTGSRFPGASLDDLMSVCGGDRLGARVDTQQTRPPLDGSIQPIIYNRGASSNNSGNSATTPGSTAATSPSVSTELLSNRIYQPAIDLLREKPEMGAQWGWTADILTKFKQDFIRYYGDLEMKTETTAASSGAPPVVKTTSVTRIAPYSQDGARRVEIDSIEILRRKVAQRVVMALLQDSSNGIGSKNSGGSADPSFDFEEEHAGLIVEQCLLVNSIPGPFSEGAGSSSSSNPSTGGNTLLSSNTDTRIAEYCRPRDKSHFYRNAALHVGDYKFTSDHCRVAWWLAQKWLDSLGEEKGGYSMQGSDSQAKRYNCELLVDLGKKLKEQQRVNDKTNAITLSGKVGKISPKPEIAQFIDYWASARSYYNSEYDLPKTVIKHVGIILTASQHPQDKELYEQAQNLIETMHINIRSEVAERLNGFQETMGKLIPVVKKDRGGSAISVMNYGSNMTSTLGTGSGSVR